MLLDAIVELLKADQSIQDLVGARVYANALPRGYTTPAILAHRYGGTQGYDFDGPVGSREDLVQVDIFALGSPECETLAQAVRDLLNPLVGALSDGREVQGCYLERDMNMPFNASADPKGWTFRTVLGYRIVNQ